jgi:signal peptidase I
MSKEILNKEFARKGLEKKGKIWIRVEGRSMEPVIKKGEKVLVKKVLPEEVSPGDVILYEIGCHLVTHRTIGKFIFGGEWYFLEKGENVRGIGRVKGKNLLGKVIGVQGRGSSLLFQRNCDEWRKTLGKGYAFLTFMYAILFKAKRFFGINPRRLKNIFFRFFLALERRLRKGTIFMGGNIEEN